MPTQDDHPDERARALFERVFADILASGAGRLEPVRPSRAVAPDAPEPGSYLVLAGLAVLAAWWPVAGFTGCSAWSGGRGRPSSWTRCGLGL